jgi:hypothetical protein
MHLGASFSPPWWIVRPWHVATGHFLDPFQDVPQALMTICLAPAEKCMRSYILARRQASRS